MSNIAIWKLALWTLYFKIAKPSFISIYGLEILILYINMVNFDKNIDNAFFKSIENIFFKSYVCSNNIQIGK